MCCSVFPDCGLERDGLELEDEVHCAPTGNIGPKRSQRGGCLVLKRIVGQQYRRNWLLYTAQREPRLPLGTRQKELEKGAEIW